MASFNDILEKAGFAFGAAAGGPSQTKVAALAVDTRNKINDKFLAFGKKVGSLTGANAFENLAKGARESSNKETTDFVKGNLPQEAVNKAIGGTILAGLGIVAAVLIVGGKK